MTGKWDDSDIPKREWRCIKVEDMGEPGPICEMCETQIIRFVHTMAHGTYSQSLQCGCICAGYMEGDPEAARHREVVVKNRTKRRFNFPGLAGWRTSRNGNPNIERDGWHVVIFPWRGGGFSGKITRGEAETWAKRVYPTEGAAKLAAFDGIEYLKAEAAKKEGF